MLWAGSLHLAMNNPSGAVQALQDYQDAGGSDPNADKRLTVAYMMLEHYEQGLAQMQNYMRETRNPSRSDYMLLKGIYNQLKDHDNEMKTLETMVTLFKDSNDIQLLTLLRKNAEVAPSPVHVSDDSNDKQMPALADADKQAAPAPAPMPADVRKPDHEYLPIKTVAPKYPARALARTIEGWVQVSFTVDTQGQVVDPKIVDSSQEHIFDKPSLDAIAQFEFRPRTENGKAVTTKGVQYVFRYQLKD